MASLKAQFKLYDAYTNTISKITKATDKASGKLLNASGNADKFNDKLNKTGEAANRASIGLGKVVSVAALVAGAVKGMNIADEFTNTSARLNLINDGLQTQAELQEKIFQSARRSRGEYTEMASAISKMGLMAADAFGSNDELIAFTELVQKSFKVGGADTSEQMGAMRQLTQAMASGRLMGDELVSIMENAPMIYNAIAKYMGLSKGELKELSSEGAITADIIKNAMFASGEDINEMFASMPKTFADVWIEIKNGALQAFLPVIETVNNLINAEGFTSFVNAILVGINIISMAVSGLINFIAENWPIIQAILMAMGIYFAFIGIQALIAGAMMAAGWLMANAPMLAIIATIAAVIYMLQQMGVTVEDIFGFIGGIIGTTVGFIMNLVIAMWNGFADFANFLGNVFNNPLAATQIMFKGWADNILGFILSVAQGLENLINKIPGVTVDITSGLTSLQNRIQADISQLKSESGWKEYVEKKEYVDLTEYATKGSDMGKSAYGKISDTISGITNSLTGAGTGINIPSIPDIGTASKPATVKGTGANGAVKVDMSDEDLKYLRDIAERDYINKFSTATLAPEIKIEFGDVHEEADADKIAGRITKILEEEIAMVAEGSY